MARGGASAKTIRRYIGGGAPGESRLIARARDGGRGAERLGKRLSSRSAPVESATRRPPHPWAPSSARAASIGGDLVERGRRWVWTSGGGRRVTSLPASPRRRPHALPCRVRRARRRRPPRARRPASPSRQRCRFRHPLLRRPSPPSHALCRPAARKLHLALAYARSRVLASLSAASRLGKLPSHRLLASPPPPFRSSCSAALPETPSRRRHSPQPSRGSPLRAHPRRHHPMLLHSRER